MPPDIVPKWAKEIERFLSVKPQFMLWGNIYDVYPMEMGGSITTLGMMDYLKTLLKGNGYSLILTYEPVLGFRCIEGTPELTRQVTGQAIEREKPLKKTLIPACEIVEKLVENQSAYSAIILPCSSRLADVGGDDYNEFALRMFRLVQGANPRIIGEDRQARHNLIIWLLDKENDLPAWYTLDNPKIKTLCIPKPDVDVRKIVIQNLANKINEFHEIDDKKRDENISLFIDQTSGLHAGEIVSIVAMARRENTKFSEIANAIRMYKLGITENPWAKLKNDDTGVTNKISGIEEKLGDRVKGQDHAICKASDIIKRSVYNLSGSQYSRYSQRPKGVLFLAGPTGVGKTELAKAITEHLFGSETSYIRFDMSEFSHEHADQRLVGAPPGYVGYDVGGQLTNAVKENPFSVILFDEIEKAHTKILDIFLQILDDGRLTSGRGETVYFSESLIIFTSNLGIYRETQDGKKELVVDPANTDYDTLSETVRDAIREFFYGIKRPEILNRIGENIVVFDFIRPNIGAGILENMLGNVLFKVSDTHGITIEFTSDAEAKLLEACCKDLSMGGRGIGNKLEEVFVNPLSRSLFEHQVKEGDTLLTQDIVQEEKVWTLKVVKRST